MTDLVKRLRSDDKDTNQPRGPKPKKHLIQERREAAKAIEALTNEREWLQARINAQVPALHQVVAERDAEIARLREALTRVERWFGEFPETGRTWNDGSPMSYAACFGSNGERDFMRDIARQALSGPTVTGSCGGGGR